MNGNQKKHKKLKVKSATETAEIFKYYMGSYPKGYAPPTVPKASEVLRERKAAFELKGLRPKRRDLSPEDRVRMDAANVLTIFREGGMKDLSPTGLRTLRSSKPGLFEEPPDSSAILRETEAQEIRALAEREGLSIGEAKRKYRVEPTKVDPSVDAADRRAVRREKEIQRLSAKHGISVERLSLMTPSRLLDLDKKESGFGKFSDDLKDIRKALGADDDAILADLRFIAEQQNNSIVLDKLDQLNAQLKEFESKRSERKLEESLPDIQQGFTDGVFNFGVIETFKWLEGQAEEFGVDNQELLDKIMTDELMADIIVSTSKDVLNASTVDSEDEINLFIADIAEKLNMSVSELINRILDAIK